MSTPFQKAFPGADENTVFEVARHNQQENAKFYQIGQTCTYRSGGGKISGFFIFDSGKCFYVDFDELRIKEPQLKKGDRCLVSDYECEGDSWSEAAYVCNLENTFGIKGEYKHLVLLDDSEQETTSWKYAKPLPPAQTVTLQDGTELTIPNDAADKLREEYA